MLHKPAGDGGPDYAIEYKARLGVWMFILYTAIYAGFVVVNVLSPLSMEKIVCFGLNLAVVYGFGLIVFALILALVYNSMCGKEEEKCRKIAEAKKGGE